MGRCVVTAADRAKAAELGPDEGCDCGLTDGSLLADHDPCCALMVCRRCAMARPDHLPGDDFCHPPTDVAAAIAAARADERARWETARDRLAKELDREWATPGSGRNWWVQDRKSVV